MSNLLIKSMILAYFIIIGFSLFEGNFKRALYYLGAILISLSILWGMK